MKGHTRRVTAIVAAGVLVAAVLVGGGWWLGERDQGQPVVSGAPVTPSTSSPATTAEPPATTAQPAPTSPVQVGTWLRLPAAPLPTGLSEYSGVWTGRELLIYGTATDPVSGLHAAGVAYNPSTNTWRKLPKAPGSAQALEGGYTTVWTGKEMLGGGLGLYGAYNPVTNRWRSIAQWGDRAAVTVWTGRQLLTWGGGCCDDFSASGRAYTLSTNTWQQLPRSPLAGRHAFGAWTGTEMIVAGGTGPDNHGDVAGYKTFADAAAYNPATRTWRRLPSMPASRSDATATWTGTELLVVGGLKMGSGGSALYADGVAYNPSTNRWRRLPAMDSSRAGHTAVWTGGQLLIWGGYTSRSGTRVAPAHGVAYDPVSNRWSALPKSPLRGRTGHVSVWTGTRMLIWGGEPVVGDRRATDGAAYVPVAL
jgi:N-acetylneuraminic acid mutarotase